MPRINNSTSWAKVAAAPLLLKLMLPGALLAIVVAGVMVFAPPHPQAESNTTPKLLYRRSMQWWLSLVGTMIPCAGPSPAVVQ